MQRNTNQYRARRWTAMLAVTVGIALLTTACSGGGTTSTGAADPGSTGSRSTSAAYAKALAYSQCIRSHGVPNFPDPTISNGSITLNLGNNADVSQSALQAAQNACKSLSPIHPLTGAQEAKNVAEGLKWAQCIRSHGVPDFPDPSSSGAFDLPSGMNPQSGSLQAAMNACQSVRPMQIQMSSGNPPGGS
jgi:hypothetical protein